MCQGPPGAARALPSVLLDCIIIPTLYFLQFVCYNVDALPLQALGPVGKMLAYLESNYLKALRLG